MSDDLDETKAFWDATAADWHIQVGDEGDVNRRLNSDPVLWRFAGEVRDRDVLDAGCGTGYLTRQLAAKGARVVGVDFSEKMIEIARHKAPDLDFRVDSCDELATIADAAVDLVVSNYVLMDTPDLEATIKAFHRVLRPGGKAVVVFSHPCFPAGRAVSSADGRQISYPWTTPYFERHKVVDPPWGHFKEEFLWFHRPLSDYWKAFKRAGFEVEDFEEPRLMPERYQLAESETQIRKLTSRPFSVAFLLRR